MMAKKWIGLLVLLASITMIVHVREISFEFSSFGDIITIIILCIFLFLVKYYPMPLSIGSASLEFPIVFYLLLRYGFIEAALVLGAVSMLTDKLSQYSAHVILFNVSNYILSLWVTYHVFHHFAAMKIFETIHQDYIAVFFAVLVFSIVNNLIVDVALLLRNQQYTLQQWFEKFKLEMIVFFVHLGYLFLYVYFHHQNRTGDVFEMTYFYIPIVTVSMISHIIAKLSLEKKKIEALFLASKKWSGTSNLDKVIAGIEQAIKKVFIYTFGVLYIKDEDQMMPVSVFGHQKERSQETYLSIAKHLIQKVEAKNEGVLFTHIHLYKSFGIMVKGFEKGAFIVVPIRIDQSVYGYIILGKERTHSFTESDKTLLQILANHASMAIRNALLVKEREKRVIAEERNRLAREIHDGIAQTVLSITLRTESCLKYIYKNPQKVEEWLSDNVNRLRESLKEMRRSIYSLRPSLPYQIGFMNAIKKKISEFEQASGILCTLEIKGTHSTSIPSDTEEKIYQIISEALQNIAKHSYASKAALILDYQKGGLLVTIQDDGVGFSLPELNLKKNKHFGLINMQELAQKLNASFHVETSEGNGTELRLKINLEQQRKEGVS